MAWLSAVIVIRYAPGQPADFFSARWVTMNDSNDTTAFVNISFSEPLNQACGEAAYNLTAAFPACDFSKCNCTNSTVCDDIYPCLPTVDCLYGDKSIESFYELCSTGFLALIGQESCNFGTLNNFQVRTVQMYDLVQYGIRVQLLFFFALVTITYAVRCSPQEISFMYNIIIVKNPTFVFSW